MTLMNFKDNMHFLEERRSGRNVVMNVCDHFLLCALFFCDSVQLFFKIVAAMISFRSRLLPSHPSNRDAHPIGTAPWHALDVLGGQRNILAPTALTWQPLQVVGQTNPGRNPAHAHQSRVVRLLLLLDGQLARVVANWLHFPTDQLILTEVTFVTIVSLVICG